MRESSLNVWQETVYGRMPASYAEDRLANLCNSVNGVQTGPFGSQLHKRDYVDVGTPIITVEHLDDNRITHQNLPRVTDNDKERLSKYILREGDIVFSRVGSVDRRSLIREAEDGWLFSGRCLRVRPNRNRIDPLYLSYFLGLPSFREHIRSIAVGATMPSINTKLLSDVTIYYPPLPEQRRIAHVLGTLDDKIELNRRMNETLEGMARAVFKDWFVDFGPVRAKMEGREAYLPEEVWGLFPDRLVESELGLVPEGWGVKSLDEIAKVVYGAAFASKRFNDHGRGVPLVRIRDLSTNNPSVFTDEVHPKGNLINPGDIVVGMDGEFKAYYWLGESAWLNQRVCHFEPLAGVSKVFLRESIVAPLALLERSKVGTTVIHLGKRDIDNFEILVSSPNILESFAQATEQLLHRIKTNAAESRSLASKRDSLLPGLVSGDVEIQDTDTVIEQE